MFRKSFASAVAVLVLLATANASLTEVRHDFLNQTKTFSATSVMTAPSADGSYLIAVYLDQPVEGTVAATIAWTDENGHALQYQAFNGSAVFAVRLQAGTTLTVQTSGAVNGSYNLFVDGVGFWN
jgi:hypothetical protein